MFSMAKPYIYAGLAGVIVAGGLFLYNEFNNLRTQRDALIAAEATLRATQKAQELTIEEILNNQQRLKVINKDLQIGLEKATKENNRLNKLFREHDLTKLATEKPGLIEKRINDATKNIFNELESITTR